MKDESDASAEDVKVKLCFFVKVLKASGLKVAGGSSIGKIVAGLNWGGGIGFDLLGIMGCAGVPNAGEEDGIGLP